MHSACPYLRVDNEHNNKRTKVRHAILIFLFLATVFNYADRATLS